MGFYTIKPHVVTSVLMVFSTTLSLLCMALFLVGASDWTDNTTTLENIAWSFFGYQIKSKGVYIGSINLYLGLLGASIQTIGDLKILDLSYPKNTYESYSSCDNISCTYCYNAGKIAFALVLVSLSLSFILLILSVLRYFKNSFLAKVIAIGCGTIASIMAIGAFANWHVNCFLYWRDNFQSTISANDPTIGIVVTKYEYVGFGFVISGAVFTAVNCILHFLAPHDSIPTPAVPQKAPSGTQKVNTTVENLPSP